MKNKLVKKTVSVIALAGLLTGLITGCGSQTTEEGQQESDTAQVQETEDVRTIYAVTGASPRPFTYYGDDNELTGQNIELVNAVFEKLPQYKLEWAVTDFPSIFSGLDADQYQIGVNNFAKNEEREEKYYFTDAIFSNAYIVVADNSVDLPESISVEDLAGYSYIGQAAVNVTTIVENYNEENPDSPIELNYTEEDLNVQLSDIESGKYDFTIIDKPMYFGYYQPEFGYDLKTASIDGYDVGEGMDSFLIVSKTPENEQLVEDINQALREVIEEGTSKEINLKYFGEDYSPVYE